MLLSSRGIKLKPVVSHSDFRQGIGASMEMNGCTAELNGSMALNYWHIVAKGGNTRAHALARAHTHGIGSRSWREGAKWSGTN